MFPELREVEKTMEHLERCRLQKLDSGHVLPGWRFFYLILEKNVRVILH